MGQMGLYLCHASANAVWWEFPQTLHVCSAWAAWHGHHHADQYPSWMDRSGCSPDARSTWNHGCAFWKFPQSGRKDRRVMSAWPRRTRVEPLLRQHLLQADTESPEDLSHVATLLHWDDAQVILLIDPDQKGLVVVVPARRWKESSLCLSWTWGLCFTSNLSSSTRRDHSSYNFLVLFVKTWNNCFLKSTN